MCFLEHQPQGGYLTDMVVTKEKGLPAALDPMEQAFRY